MHALLASIAFAKGLKEEGKAQLRAAIAGDPHHVSSYRRFARSTGGGDWEEAKKLCEQAHEVDTAAHRS